VDASKYREQFIAFLKVMYPEGLPDEKMNTVCLRYDDKEFNFRFDQSDLKRKTLRKTAAKPKKVDFEDRLTDGDKEWLKKLQINVEEQPQ
jgi:hypothetical protein